MTQKKIIIYSLIIGFLVIVLVNRLQYGACLKEHTVPSNLAPYVGLSLYDCEIGFPIKTVVMNLEPSFGDLLPSIPMLINWLFWSLGVWPVLFLLQSKISKGKEAVDSVSIRSSHKNDLIIIFLGVAFVLIVLIYLINALI